MQDNMKKGQSTVTVIVSITTLLASSTGIGFLYNNVSRANDTIIDHESRVSKVEEVITCIPEIKGDVKIMNENLMKLMYSQGIKPVEQPKLIASSSPKEDSNI